VLKTLGISESDFLYANFSNDVGVNPYIILVDRKWKTILLAIRGTLSMEDMISDVTISPTSLEECGERFGFDGEGEYCHNGILAGAKWVYEDLERWVTLVVFIWVTVVPWN
jgi:sn1-specific diacylglycerol lipase